MDLLDTLHDQGSTIVMVTHDPRFAERADRQVSLFDGKIVDDRRLRLAM
jgi:putative ABC transport system ATP-binding protein